MNYNNIITRLEGIVRRSDKPEAFDSLRAYIDGLSHGMTPGFGSIGMAASAFAKPIRHVTDADSCEYESLATEVIDHMNSIVSPADSPMGYTYQEFRLTGATDMRFEESDMNPYMPMGPQLGLFSMNEAVDARERMKSMRTMGMYFLTPHGLRYGDTVSVTLEPLDENGETVRDPVMIDSEDGSVMMESEFIRSDEFPFRRD